MKSLAIPAIFIIAGLACGIGLLNSQEEAYRLFGGFLLGFHSAFAIVYGVLWWFRDEL